MLRRHQLLSVLLANGHLLRVSRQSRLSSDDKGDSEVKAGAVHRYLDICLTAE